MADKTRIAVIGAGAISSGHVQGYRAHPDECEVAVIADINPERADARKEEFGIPEAVYDAEQVWARDDIQAVSVCLPHHLHEPFVIRAAEAGLHVLCEKPFTLSVASLDRMAAACEQAGVACMSAQVLRFRTAHRATREFIRSGALGRIHQVCRRRGGISRSLYADWYHSAEQGGEILIHGYGTHEYDLLMWMQDVTCEAVYACGRRNNPTWNGYDEVSAIFHLSDGSFANIRQSLNTLDAGSDQFFMADNGCLRAHGSGFEWQPVEGEKESREFEPDPVGGFPAECGEFLAAIREGREPEASARQVRWVQAVMEAAVTSIRENRVVNLREQFGEFGAITVS